jgi:hypothetical protein
LKAYASITGAHVLPLDAVVGLEMRDETVEDLGVRASLLVDV